MQRWIAVLWLTLLSNAYAEDGPCPRASPSAGFTANAPGVRSAAFKKINGHEAIETLALQAGEQLRIRHWGCEYFVVTLSLSGPEVLKRSATPAAAYGEVAALLQRLAAMKPRLAFDLALAAKALSAQAGNRKPAPLGEDIEVAGDGEDALQAQVKLDMARRREASGTLEVTLTRGPL